jgi:pyruvate,water dikinase
MNIEELEYVLLISYLRKQEIIEFLQNGIKPNKVLISQRMEGFLVFKKQGEVICVSGKEIDEEAESIGFKRNANESGEIKGKVASRGNVRGKAKIIVNEKDLVKIDKGDIMVALTTGPAYVPAMARAAAFVTDQGGITCHAAIVAREMSKPCIVGTQNATRIIKDGDLVEVDADVGIVRKC